MQPRVERGTGPDGERIGTAARERRVPGRWREALARTFVQLAPTERQRLLGLTIVIGGLCGLAAVAFHVTLDLVSTVAINRAMSAPGASWLGWTLLCPALGGLLCGAILQYVVPGARGSGIPEVKIAFARKGGRLRLTDSLGKFVVSALQIGTGAALGREGPTVHICAGLASGLGRLVGVSHRNVKRLLPVGAAAGIAAAFNAPIAAVTFTIEEVIGRLDQTVLSGVIVAAALAAVVERTILGVQPMLTAARDHGLEGPGSLFLYAALGVVAGGMSLAFSESLLWLRARFRRAGGLPGFATPAVGGLVTGGMAVIGLLLLRSRGVAGGGYETLNLALTGNLALKALIGLSILKLIATVFSYGSGGAGGIFAPALFIGGTLGGAFGALDMAVLHHPASSLADFALVGMGATFAGIIRAPMTSILIIIEMTNGYALILPLMIANMTSYAIARMVRPKAIYDALLEQDGINLSERGGDPRERILVRELDALTTPHASLSRAQAALEMLRASAQHQRQEVFPVLDDDGRLVGLVTTEDLAILAAEPDLEGIVNAVDLMRPPIALRLDDDLRTAFDRMMANGVKQLPVVDEEERVVALIDEGAIARAVLQHRPKPS